MRLPPFLTEKPLIGAVLDASDAGAALLEADVNRRNDQLSYRTADEGLRRWEQDLSLPSDGDAATRRARIYAALTGGRTLTVEELEKLALTLTDAQQAVVTERFADYLVVLSALFDGEAGDLTALRKAVERRRPAHLDIRVQSTLPAREIVYYGLATPLSVARSCGNGVSAEGFALYGGGEKNNSVYDDVDAYDAQLVRTLPSPLLSPVQEGAAAMAGEMAVFAGGASDIYGQTEATPTAYSPELTRSAVPGLSMGWTQRGGAVSNGPYAVFGGGVDGSARSVATVTAVSDTLVSSCPAAFSTARGYYGAARAGESILFAGGGDENTWSVLSSVEAYGPELEKIAVSPLPGAVACPGSAEAGENAVFCGGGDWDGTVSDDTACAYSPELTRTMLENLSVPRHLMQSVAFAGNALFAGGKNGQIRYAAADCYDEELVHTVLPDISIARNEYNDANGRGAVVGEYALICGGQDDSQYYDTVDVFTVK